MKTYSHVRQKALDGAAAVLEPVSTELAEPTTVGRQPEVEVTSHATSQSVATDADVKEIIMNLAPQVGFEPTTLRLTDKKRLICRVLRAIAASRRIANPTR
jgi:hypothetical protein